MILKVEYRDEILDFVREIPEEKFHNKHMKKEQILTNPEIIDNLWTCYQKEVEEYGCDPEFALHDTLYEVLSGNV